MSHLRQTIGNRRLIVTETTWILQADGTLLAKYKDRPREIVPTNDMTVEQFEALWADAKPTHKFEPGTHLMLQLPFAESLHENEHQPFFPGIKGTVECWIIGQEPYVPDQHGYLSEPEYIISPYRTPQRACRDETMWERFASDEEAVWSERHEGPVPPMDSQSWHIMQHRLTHNVERNLPESLLAPFIRAN